MNRSPAPKKETNRSNPEIHTRTGSARRLIDYTQQRGEGETHKDTIGNQHSEKRSLSTRSLRTGIPTEIVLDKRESRPTSTISEQKKAMPQERSEEVVDFILEVPQHFPNHQD